MAKHHSPQRFAGALLTQARRAAQAAGTYTQLLAKLDQLQQELASAYRSECVAAERLRMARELHDRCAQTLFALGLTADWLLSQVEPEEPWQPDLERLRQMAATGHRQLREAISALSAPPVDPAGLNQAVRSLLQEAEAAGIRTVLQISGDLQRLPPEVADALHQIIREAGRHPDAGTGRRMRSDHHRHHSAEGRSHPWLIRFVYSLPMITPSYGKG
jgi:signal transduction histidine kinase